MTNVVDLSSRLKQRPPAWGATVTIGPDGAELSGFWDTDPTRTPSERCAQYADALYDLMSKLRETSRLIADSPSG